MLNKIVSIGNVGVGRMIAGLLNLSSSHPIVLCVILATLAALVTVTWVDLIGIRLDTLLRQKAETDRPIRLRRS